MTGGARVDPAAIEEVARALVRYGTAEEAVMAQAESALRGARGTVTSQLSRRRRELDAAETALQACRRQEKADCRALEAAARKARARLEAAQRALRQVDEAATRYQAVQSKHSAVVRELVRSGRTHLDRKSGQLAAYAAGGGGGSGGSGGMRGASGSVPSARRELAGMVGKAVARELALTFLTQGGGLLHENLGAPGVDQVIEQVIRTAQSPGFGPAMAGEMRQAVHFDQWGPAMAEARRRLRE
jgi:hypothetical protein